MIRRWMTCFLVAMTIGGMPAQAMRAASAGTGRPDEEMPADPFIETETVRLWPGRAPGATADVPAQTPTLTIMRPQKGQANGSAVIIAPGGGYVELAGNIEGRQVADWFASRGVVAFVLRYRVGPAARLPIPLEDGARAIRLVRSGAARFGIDPRRIGMIGFSAGGHLAAMTAATGAPGGAVARDAIDRASSRPDFLILGYPWLEATTVRPDGTSAYCTFAKTGCDPAQYAGFMPLSAVTKDMPPTFIYHTSDDPVVGASGVTRFYDALQARGVPVELHIFASGRHGSGLGGADPALARWPELMEHWLRAMRVVQSATSVRPGFMAEPS